MSCFVLLKYDFLSNEAATIRQFSKILSKFQDIYRCNHSKIIDVKPSAISTRSKCCRLAQDKIETLKNVFSPPSNCGAKKRNGTVLESDLHDTIQ